MKKIDSLGIDTRDLQSKKKELESQTKKLANDLAELRDADRQHEKRIAACEANIKTNEKKLQERQKILAEIKEHKGKDIKHMLDEAIETSQKTSTEMATKQGRVVELREWVKELSKHISSCPICERELDEELRKKLLNQKSKNLETFNEEIENHGKKLKSLADEQKKLKELHEKLIAAEGRLQDSEGVEKIIENEEKIREAAQKAHKEAAAKITEIEKEHEKAKESLNKALEDERTLKRKEGYDTDMKLASKKIEANESLLKEIDIDEKTIDAEQGKYLKCSNSHSEIASKVQGNTKLIAELDRQMSDKQTQIKEYQSTEKRIEKKRKQLANLNKFKAALIDTEALLRNRLVSSINGLMQELWPQLYPYGDYLGIRLATKKDDYLLEVNANVGVGEAWLQVDGIASGGERSIACLAMRIALAMVVVPNLRWLILDEPTHNIDSSGISKLIEVLGGTLPRLVDQIFIITHDEELKQINPAKVYLLNRDKAANAPTESAEL